MSSDNQKTPPRKLSLSRDNSGDGDTQKNTPPPAMKLKRKSETKGPAAPTQGTSDSSIPPKPETKTSIDTSDDYDPGKPFGDSIKKGDNKEPKGPPAELKNKSLPIIDDQFRVKIEKATQPAIEPQANDTTQNSEKSSFLASVAVILLLLAVLAGAGYGIWTILQSSQDEATQKETTEANEPIQRTKDLAAKVDSASTEGKKEVGSFTVESPISAQNSADVANAQPKPGSASSKQQIITQRTKDLVTKADSTSTVEAPISAQNSTDAASALPKPGSVSSKQQIITEYLSSAHIGGMRDGSRPMIILNNVSYQAGDTVHTESGLAFAGFRNGKPAFRDAKGFIYLKSF